MSTYTLHDLPTGLFKPVHIPVSAGPLPINPLSGALRIGGWSFWETTNAAPALIELWDGGAVGGETVAVISLLANASSDRACPGLGLYIQSGLTIMVLNGSIRGSIWLALA